MDLHCPIDGTTVLIVPMTRMLVRKLQDRYDIFLFSPVIKKDRGAETAYFSVQKYKFCKDRCSQMIYL